MYIYCGEFTVKKGNKGHIQNPPKEFKKQTNFQQQQQQQQHMKSTSKLRDDMKKC